MSKRLYFLISFVLALGLIGTARAGPIEVNNHSFEYDINGVQITELIGLDSLQGWTLRDTGDMGAWFFATPDWPSEGFEAADGNVVSFCPTWHGADGDILEIYQILDPNIDANATIAENRRYTLTFNALKTSVGVDPDVNALLFYSVGVGEVNEADSLNDVILASKRTKLTSPPWGEDGYAGWEEVTLTYIAVSGAGSIGERLGIKLNVPEPWYDGVFVGMDNVRLEWSWATNAWDPDPADEGEDVPRTGVTLSWKPGSFAADVNGHEVYLGTDEASVEDATTATAVIYRGSGNVAGPDANGRYSYVIPGGDLPLDLGGTYYWRIDEVNEGYAGPPVAAPDANGRWKGNVWSFTVEGRAKAVYPADGAGDIPSLNLTLYWEAGTGAGSHDVYFGTSQADVTDANTANTALYPGVFRGNQPDVNDPNYPVEDLEVGESYFWRIDEVNTTTGTFVEGHVWSFTTGVFLIVESFEPYRYKNTADLRDVWKDWFADPGLNDALVTLFFAKTNEDKVIDEQSMEFAYRNYNQSAGKYVGAETEAALPLEVGTNWTAGGVKALVMNFYGDAGNAQEGDYYTSYHITNDQMYVALEDGSTKVGLVKLPDMTDIQEESWHTWNISLQDPNFSDVNLANVVKVYIGFGGTEKTGQSKGGAGTKSGKYDTVWFDDIRLYPPRCMPEMTGIDVLHALGDFTEDCNTDYFDLDVMARDWLMSGANVPPSAPGTDAIAWYKFDEGIGTTTANSGTLGSTYNGVLVNGPVWTTEAHPNDGNALDFDGTDDGVYVADSPNMTGDNTVSFTAWVKREADISAYMGVIVMSRDEGEGSEGDNGTGVHTDKTGTNALGYTWNNWQESWGWESGLLLPLNKWVFVALTVEPTQAIMYLAEPNDADPNIYDLSSATNAWGHDGLSEYGDSRGGWDGTSPIYLGRDDPNKTDDATFPGKISDIRIYDYTLSRGNIMYLAGVSGTAYVPLEDWRADINGDDKVDFRDYSVLANNWLEEILWPPQP